MKLLTLLILSVLVFGSSNYAVNALEGSSQPNLNYDAEIKILEIQPVIKQTTLDNITIGDVFSYKTDSNTTIYDANLEYSENTSFNSFRYVQIQTSIFNSTNSLAITTVEDSFLLANSTETEMCTLNRYYLQEYAFFGDGASGPVNTTDEITHPNYLSSYFSEVYLETSNITQLDISSIKGYSSVLYQYNSTFNYTMVINNALQEFEVEEYLLYGLTKTTSTMSKYGFTYYVSYIDTTEARMLVEKNTKIPLVVNMHEMSQVNYSEVKFSDEYGADVILERLQITENSHNWYLTETTKYFNPVEDADVPALLWENNDQSYISDNTSVLEIPVYLIDTSNVSLKIFANGMYVDTINFRSGQNLITIPECKLWPNLESGYVVITVELTDTPGHNSIWRIVYEDYRSFHSTWQPWIEGEEYFEFYTYETPDELEFKVYASTVWWITTEKLLDNGTWVKEDDEFGYKNGTYMFDLRNLPEGIYDFRIFLFDFDGNMFVFNFSMEYFPPFKDYTKPRLYGPSGLIQLEAGGNISEIVWFAYDMHPNFVSIRYSLGNNNLGYDLPWSECNQSFAFEFNPEGIATYDITITAIDLNSNSVSLHLILEIIPKSDTNTNTITNTTTSLTSLDNTQQSAINLLTVIIAPTVLSIFVIHKRRTKRNTWK